MKWTWIARIVTSFATAAALLCGVLAGPASAATTWIDGSFDESYVINCPSMIFGNSYTEVGLMSYVGYEGDLSSATPSPTVGQTFYTHVVVGAAGNSCSGQYVQPTLALPAGLVANITGSTPTKCYFQSGLLPCTAVLAPNGSYYWKDSTGSTIWGVATGKTLEFLLPVRATTKVVSRLQASIAVADGNSNPTLVPSVGVLVLPSGGTQAPVIYYPSPSTAITPGNPPSHISYANVTNSTTGNVFFDIGTSPASYSYRSPAYGVNAGSNQIQTAWSGLTGGQIYYWRFCFRATGASVDTACGTEQHFTALAADSVRPTVVSITPLANPVHGPNAAFKIVFSEPVTGVMNSLVGSSSNLTVGTATLSPSSGYSSVFTLTVPVGLTSPGISSTLSESVLQTTLVTDVAGNTLANSASSGNVSVVRPTADTARPSIVSASLPAVSLGAASQAWTASDAGGLGYFSMKTLTKTAAGVSSAWSSAKIYGPTLRKATVAVTAGRTTCDSVTAVDSSGNRTTATTRCTATPFDDRSLHRVGTWTNVTSTSAFNRTLSKSVAVGASVTITAATGHSVIVVANRAVGAGVIQVLVNGVVKSTWNLAASTSLPKQILQVPITGGFSHATISVRVKSKGSTGVLIDGFGIGA